MDEKLSLPDEYNLMCLSRHSMVFWIYGIFGSSRDGFMLQMHDDQMLYCIWVVMCVNWFIIICKTVYKNQFTSYLHKCASCLWSKSNAPLFVRSLSMLFQYYSIFPSSRERKIAEQLCFYWLRIWNPRSSLSTHPNQHDELRALYSYMPAFALVCVMMVFGGIRGHSKHFWMGKRDRLRVIKIEFRYE